MTSRPPVRRRAVPATLRARVTAVAALAVLAVLGTASTGIVLAHWTALVDAVDEALDQQADALVGQLRAGRDLDAGDLPSDDVVAEVIAPDGMLLAASDNLEGRLPWDGRGGDGADVATVELPGGEGSARLLEKSARDRTVLVAGNLDDARDSTAALAGALVVAVPLTSLVLAAIVWWAVGRTLRPVEEMRAQVDSISAARLDQRLPEPGAPHEIARLAHTMNAMLARLQRAADEQRRFVADASHELRSPLARMRAELEVDAAHPGSADPAATSASVLADTVTLQRLVDDLLLLARGDAGALAAAPGEPVDLDHVVGTVVLGLRAIGERRIDTRGVQPAQVMGDRQQLERAVGNLLQNAVRHARDQVVITLAQLPDGGAELVVADDGPGVPPDAREWVFERFTRLDDARSAGSGGAGLGLAIARDIAVRHGGDLTLDPQGGPGARFVLRLPADLHPGETAGRTG